MHDTLRQRAAGLFVLTMVLMPWLAGSGAEHGLRPAASRTEKSSDPKPVAPPFSIQKLDAAWWLVSPEGKPFFSRGVCCVGPGVSRTQHDPENPEYAAWKYYTNTTDWAAATVKRLRAWGFTTAGGWCDYPVLRPSPDMTLGWTPVLHIGSTAGAPWWDMWDPATVRRMDDTARAQILAFRDDPRLLGYYSDNELGWWNATLFKMTLEQPASSGQRKRLIRLLRDHYANNWNRLLADFEPENAAGWTGLERRGMLFLRPGGHGIHVMRRFLGLLAERYYQLVHDIIRKYDRPLWVVEANGLGPIRARIGAGREPLVNDPGVKVLNLSGLNLNVRNLAILEIPAQRLGKERLKAGDSIDLNVTLATHCQAYSIRWKGQFTLAD